MVNTPLRLQATSSVQHVGAPSEPSSITSSSPTNTRLTPTSDDDDDSDLDLQEAGDSYRMQSRNDGMIREKERLYDGEESEEEDEKYKEFRSHQGRRGSASTVQSYQLYTPDEEKAVVRKFDRRLVLFVALLYMLSFLDRSSMLIHRMNIL